MSGKDVVLAFEADSFFLRGYYARGRVCDYKLFGVVSEGILAALGAGYIGKACPRAHLWRRALTGLGLWTVLAARGYSEHKLPSDWADASR